MRVSPKIFPVAVFLLVVGASAGLLIFPNRMYQLLLWVLESFQAGGLPLLFFAMILQALVIPIPSELILICGGAAFGLLSGWLVGAVGSVVAALIGFYISRKGGRSVAIRFVGDKGIEFADNWFSRWGAWAVLLGRIAPFIPFDVISYSAGLTQMKFRSFIVPTVIGTLPRALFYAFLGVYFEGTLQDLIEYYREYGEIPSNLHGNLFMFNIILLTIVVVMASILIVYWFVTRRYAARKETKSI
jgi:uncharacterized membrane protein YdjX (TVP38/TMEM64 family)